MKLFCAKYQTQFKKSPEVRALLGIAKVHIHPTPMSNIQHS